MGAVLPPNTDEAVAVFDSAMLVVPQPAATVDVAVDVRVGVRVTAAGVFVRVRVGGAGVLLRVGVFVGPLVP